MVEIITPDEVTSPPASNAPAHTRGWDEDPIMRSIHALRQLVRPERISSEGISALPTYEHVMNPILAQRGTGEQFMEGEGTDSRVLVTLHPDEWGELNLVRLEHNNLAMDGIRIRPEAGSTDPVLRNWLVALELKLPCALWRERLQDARQQLWVAGRYDLGVILFATATEVLLDGLLQMLWWEKALRTRTPPLLPSPIISTARGTRWTE